LRAAMRYFHASKYGPSPSVPVITLLVPWGRDRYALIKDGGPAHPGSP
jgi:hypothetical protein